MPKILRIALPVAALALFARTAPDAFGWGPDCYPTTGQVVIAPSPSYSYRSTAPAYVQPVRQAPRATLVGPTHHDELYDSPIAWKSVIGVKTGNRSLAVWLADPASDRAVESRVFDDESLRVASRGFRTVRITPAAAKSDSFMSAYARFAPALIVFSPDLERATILNGSTLDTRNAMDALRVRAKNDMGYDLDETVRKARSLTAERKTVENLKSALVQSAPSDTKRASDLDRRLTTIRAQLDSVYTTGSH